MALTGDLSTTGTIKPARIGLPGVTSAEKPPRASPINDTVIFVAPSDREARLQSRELPASVTRIAERTTAGGLNGMLARISLSLDKVEQRQAATLTDLEKRIDTRARRSESTMATHLPKGQLEGHLFRSSRHSRAPAPSNANFTASISPAPRSTATATNWWPCQSENP
ncbi:MAG: hypothetical protein WBW99_06025 [Pseudolabrys sp.]